MTESNFTIGFIGLGLIGGSIAKVMGFESNDEYNQIMFLREITHTVNAFNDMADIVRLYSKKPETAEQRLANLLSEVLYEDSDSVQNDNRSYDIMSTSESGCLQI